MKNSWKWFGMAAILVMVIASGFQTGAQEPKGKKGKPSKGDPGVKAFADSITLAGIGREKKLPEALIAAAKLIATVKVTTVEGSDKEAALDPVDAAKKWLAEAEKMPAATLTIKKLIAATREDVTSGKRGATYGAQQWPGKVGALATKSRPFPMKGSCEVALMNSGFAGGGELSLEIKGDKSGFLGGSSCVPGRTCQVPFELDAPETVTVTVRSNDPTHNLQFHVVTN